MPPDQALPTAPSSEELSPHSAQEAASNVQVTVSPL